jgi:hypothetical protein
VSYNAVVSGAGGTAAIGSFTQTAAQMATPNFKGLPNYPRWTPAPTRAVYNHAAPSTTSPVDPKDLSMAQQAQALLAELGGTSIVDIGANSVTLPDIGQIVFPVTYPPDDPRRLFAVVLSSGKLFNVGQALAEKYSAGMGAPGSWIADATQISGLNWQATAVPDGSASTASALPVPCRTLLANERLKTSLVGGLEFQITQIQRTDLIPAAAPACGAGGADPVLLDIQVKVTALYNLIVPRAEGVTHYVRTMGTIHDLHLGDGELGADSNSLAACNGANDDARCFAGRNYRDLSCLVLCGGREP